MNVSTLKYNILLKLSIILFGQNVTRSIYSTFLKFPSQRTIHVNMEFMGIQKQIFCYISVTKLEKSDQIKVF